MSAINECIVNAYFNGTPINFPFLAPAEKIFKIIEERVLGYDDDIEFYYNQTVEMERKLNENSKRGFVTEKRLERTAKETGFDDATGFIIIWFCNIYYLIKKGRIIDDNNFGFTTHLGGEGMVNKVIEATNKLYEDSGVCGLCKLKANLKCQKCGQRYCCREHQVQDWKEHSKMCKLHR
jgi:hypothetical protein